MESAVNQISIVRLRDQPRFLADVVRWVHGEWSTYSGRTLKQTHERFAQEFDSDELPQSMVVLQGDIPVGLATLRVRDSVDWDPAVTPWVCNVYVTPNARGKGVAQKLCKQLEKLAIKRGYRNLYLACMVAENSLYQRVGYVTYKVSEREGHAVYLMSLRLTVAPGAGN